MAKVAGTGPAELRLLSAKLRAADPALRRELLRQFRKVAAPTVRRVQASALGMPAVKYHEGLREQVARTVYASTGVTKAGARLNIVSAGRRMPEGKENLPAYMNRARGWGHPVFQRRGRRAVWVRQHGDTSWFESPVIQAAPALRQAAQRAIDDVKHQLER